MRLSTLLGLAILGSLCVAANLDAQDAPARRPGGMFQPDPFRQTIDALGDLNLRPSFKLGDEQKTKVQAVRDDVKKAADKWRSDHAADLKKLQDDMQAARQGQDQDKMREVMTKRRELMQTMPKTDDAAKQVKAILTEDQAKALETCITERQAEMGNRMGGGGGGRPAGAGGN